MQIIQSRRDFLAALSEAGAASLLGIRASLANEPPPEVTTLRLRRDLAKTLCIAPNYVAEELLLAEGFTEIRYVFVEAGLPVTQAFERGELDFAMMFAPGAVRRLDAGAPITVLAGVHPGCFELFVHPPVRTFTDLKGRRVGIAEALGSADHLFVSIMAAHVGLDPQQDINWITPDDGRSPMQLFLQGKIDAYLAGADVPTVTTDGNFVPETIELRARKIGRAIVNMALDKPWSQYFCCMFAGQADFVREYPVAAKRVLRAILKATDMCSAEPERAAKRLVESGFAQHYDHALQVLAEIPYASWREFDPADSLRFYALWLHDFGELDATPNKIIAEGTDWRFLNELKRELKY